MCSSVHVVVCTCTLSSSSFTCHSHVSSPPSIFPVSFTFKQTTDSGEPTGERSVWNPDKKAAQTQAVGLQQRHSLSSSPLRQYTSPALPFDFAPLCSPFFFFPVLSSAFCFNSHLITSHVPHKVLISSLPLESARLTGTHAQIHTRMHVHTPHHRFLCVPHWCVTCTCIFNACAPWLHFII